MDRVNGLRQLMDDRQRALGWAADKQIQSGRRRLETVRQRLDLFSPSSILARRRQRLHDLERRLQQATSVPLRMAQQRLERGAAALEAHHPRRAVARRAEHLRMLEKQLNALGPQQVLQRGYTMTLGRKGQVIRRADALKTGDRLLTRFADGDVESIVRDSRQGELFP
jgi:exodeoxyribonuclease VII large subunit